MNEIKEAINAIDDAVDMQWLSRTNLHGQTGKQVLKEESRAFGQRMANPIRASLLVSAFAITAASGATIGGMTGFGLNLVETDSLRDAFKQTDFSAAASAGAKGMTTLAFLMLPLTVMIDSRKKWRGEYREQLRLDL